jgi:hypothetical protein
MSDDKLIKLVDELAVSLGLDKPGDRMPGLRFSWEQIVILDKIRIQERREAAKEIREHWFGDELIIRKDAADLIDPDIKGDDNDGS